MPCKTVECLRQDRSNILYVMEPFRRRKILQPYRIFPLM